MQGEGDGGGCMMGIMEGVWCGMEGSNHGVGGNEERGGGDGSNGGCIPLCREHPGCARDMTDKNPVEIFQRLSQMSCCNWLWSKQICLRSSLPTAPICLSHM